MPTDQNLDQFNQRRVVLSIDNKAQRRVSNLCVVNNNPNNDLTNVEAKDSVDNASKERNSGKNSRLSCHLSSTFDKKPEMKTTNIELNSQDSSSDKMKDMLILKIEKNVQKDEKEDIKNDENVMKRNSLGEMMKTARLSAKKNENDVKCQNNENEDIKNDENVMKKNILGEMMKTARLSAKKNENDVKLGSSKKKRIKKQVTGLMKRNDEKLMKNEKSELEVMFERMKRKKIDENMVKTKDLKMKEESTMKNEKDEKKMSYDEKNISGKIAQQFNPPKLKHPEKVSQKAENILKIDVKMKKKDEMNHETDEDDTIQTKIDR